MESLGAKLSQRKDGVLFTTELSPPNTGSDPDISRFQRHLELVRQLLGANIIDGFTTNSLPQFSQKEIRDIQAIAPGFLELIGCDADTIEAILMEVTQRTSSMDVGDLGDLETSHIRTLAIQRQSPFVVKKSIQKQPFASRAAFVVSGGHPLRKFVTLLNHKFPLIGRLAQLVLFYNYDSSSAVADLRSERPDVVGRFASWNPATESVIRLGKKVQSGANGLFTQPASLLPRVFTQALQELRNNEQTKNLRIQIGIPFISSVTALKKWFFLMGISPETHREAGFLLESFEKAERDGRLTFFADTWTRNCLEWALSLAAGDGVHYMAHTLSPRTIGILTDVRSLGQHSTGMDILLQSKEALIDWQIRYDALQPRIGLTYLSGMLESSPKKDYAEEFLPLVGPTYEIIQELKKTHPNHTLWQNLSVNFIRMPQNNHAHALPVEIITDDIHSFNEIIIDVRYPLYKTNPELFKKRLRESLLSELRQTPVEHHVYLGERGGRPFLDRVLSDGWNEFSHVQKAENKPDVGTSTAKNSIVYERAASEFLESLKKAPEREEYAACELGVYDANGMPEMFRHLAQLIFKEHNSKILWERLKKTVFVCVDFAQDGLNSCQQVLSRHPELTGMFQSFRYIKGDIMDGECRGQLEEWKGKFLFMRAINTLDAFPEPSYVVRQGSAYRVEYDTLVDSAEIKKLVTELYPPTILKDKKSHLVYFIEGQEQLPLALGSVTENHIFQALRVAENIPTDTVNAFISTIMNEAQIPREAAVLIWLRVLHILKKKKRFVSVTDADEKKHVLDVASHHPDPRIPFVLSHHATRFMSHLGSFLDPVSGTAFFTNLTSSLSSQYLTSHHSSQGPATPGITGSQPVQPEPIVTSFTSNGLQLHVIPHKDHPQHAKELLRPTASMMLVKHGQ